MLLGPGHEPLGALLKDLAPRAGDANTPPSPAEAPLLRLQGLFPVQDELPAARDAVCHLSPLCLCFPEVAEQLMTIAYESGVNLFDTAEVYAAGK